MADIQPNDHPRKKGKARRKNKSTRIDMTAMVDVAFLLLTFFVLTATLNGLGVMDIAKPPICPPDEDCYKDIPQEKMLTLILGAEDSVHYYQGMGEDNIQHTDFSPKGIRKTLLNHLNRYPNLCEDGVLDGNCWDPIFVVKPHKSSRYKNLVDVLDELAILGAEKYVIADYTQADSLIMHQALAVNDK